MKPPEIVLAMRQSPDWQRLSSDFLMGSVIKAANFVPQERVPGFPSDLIQLIGLWNSTYSYNYFRCRSELRYISQRTVETTGLSAFPHTDLNENIGLLHPDTWVFFFDDDDWFAPNIKEVCRKINLETRLCTFPLPLIGKDYLTLVDHTDLYLSQALGPTSEFRMIFHTNNYGVRVSVLKEFGISNFKDHVIASEFALKQNLVPAYIPNIISASVKSPASAGRLSFLKNNKTFEIQLNNFIDELNSINPPPQLSWMNEAIEQTTILFRDLRNSKI